jgi:arylsulfatase A-like enzyme
MKNWLRISAAWFVVLFLLASALNAEVRHVIIVSIDGGRPDYLLMASTSNIHSMVSQGSYTWWAQSTEPSETLPCHCSMLSGSQPEKHGVTWNGHEPEKGFVKAVTCFELVKKSGGRTAMFVGKEKLQHIAKPDTVDHFEAVRGGSEKISRIAAAYFVTNQPTLMFVHYAGPDGDGHGVGWGSACYLRGIESVDRGIGILEDGVRQAKTETNTLFIITADHGGAGRRHCNIKGRKGEDIRYLTIPWVAFGPGNISTGEVQASVSTCDTAATAVHALGLTPDPQWDGRAIVEIFTGYSPPPPKNRGRPKKR